MLRTESVAAATMSSLDSVRVLVLAGVVVRYQDWAARVPVVRSAALVLEREGRMDRGHVADSMVAKTGLIGGAALVMAEDVAGALVDMRVAGVLRGDLVAAGVGRGGAARVRHVEAAHVTKVRSRFSFAISTVFNFPWFYFKGINRVCIAASRCHENEGTPLVTDV